MNSTNKETNTPKSFAESTATFYRRLPGNKLREITLVNKKEEESYLLTIIDCEAEQEYGEPFTYETHTDQFNTICTLLKNNGYKEDPNKAYNAKYHTYEDNTPIMSMITETLNGLEAFENILNLSSLFPMYLQEVPLSTEVNVLHFDNNQLRNKYGIPVQRDYHAQLVELTQASCGIDILDYKTKDGKYQYVVIDFAIEIEYERRRNLFYELGIEDHCDVMFLNMTQLVNFIEQSKAEQFILKSAKSLYAFGMPMTDAFILNTTSVDKINADKKYKEEAQTNNADANKHSKTNNAIGICLERGILI